MMTEPDDLEGMDVMPPSAAPDIRGRRPGEAVEAIKKWFFNNFEDPAESTPYESAEGGYQYIWGGPYDAREEIEEAFGDQVTEAMIERAVNEIEYDGWEWAPAQGRIQPESDVRKAVERS